ncbi:MAG: 6-phosphogluconolactonase [Nitrospiraceae bacterium]|nr:MAG: 6-phosphogluconolactonase [Nitrospiraceae bacterium]
MVKEVLIFSDMDNMAGFVIGKWREFSGEAIKDRGYFTVALSGGKTPAVLYQKITGEDLPWDKTHVFMVDERFVPYGSRDNNYHMINRVLLRHVPIPAKNIHPIITSDSSPGASANKYEEDIASFFRKRRMQVPEIDLILLGIGEDGHTASLFPGTPALRETRRLVFAVSPENSEKKERISLTLPVINNARNVMFLAGGAGKAKIIRDVIEGGNRAMPAALVKPDKGNLFFLLDKEAASLLTGNYKPKNCNQPQSTQR